MSHTKEHQTWSFVGSDIYDEDGFHIACEVDDEVADSICADHNAMLSLDPAKLAPLLEAVEEIDRLHQAGIQIAQDDLDVLLAALAEFRKGAQS